MTNNAESMTNLSTEELEALAKFKNSSVAQDRLSELIERSKQETFSISERQELDRLLRQADQLTLLKTRLRFTLRQIQRDKLRRKNEPLA